MNPLVDPLVARAPEPFRRAVGEALVAPTLGGAFLGGYRAACEALVPGLEGGALLATEDGPLHPAAITTRLEGGALTGRKRFATGVPGARELLVLATAGREGDRQRLVVAVVDAGGPGVVMRPMDPLPFVPEVPHATVELVAAPAVRVLPGDGWREVVRPFRTVEDLHVLGAIAAHLLGAARRAGFPREAVTALGAALSGMATLAGAPVSDPGVHLALAGVIDGFRRATAGLSWADPDEDRRWKRDLPLLSVAGKAREARLEAAWQELGERP